MHRLFNLNLLSLAAACFLIGCSVQKVPDSTISGSSCNWYQSTTSNNLRSFRTDLLSWAEKNHFILADSGTLKLSKEYASHCVAVVWIEGDTKSVFKLMESVDFRGDNDTIWAANDKYKNDSASLFEAMKAYYVSNPQP